MDEVINNDEIKNEDSQGEDELSRLKKERDEYLDGWQRARAEMINYKKDEAKRFQEMVKFSIVNIVRELLVVLDSFDIAISALEKDGKAEKGFYLIRAQLEDILKNFGLEKIVVSVGESFDPNLHEAVAEAESDKPSGTIVEEVDKGYMLNGKLIRPVRVKIAK